MVPIPKIVIAGGGIVGNSIAYFLAQRNVPCTIVDPVGIAPCASGKAGGFLAQDWRDGTPLMELQRKGFALHQHLADINNNNNNSNNNIDNNININNQEGLDAFQQVNIDYRRLTCQAVAVDANQPTQRPINRKSRTLEWVDQGGVLGSSSMGKEDTIAQVHPRKLCEAMWEYSASQGCELKIGKVVKVLTEKGESRRENQNDDDGDDNENEKEGESIKAIQLEDGTTLAVDKLVIACGPWTEQARYWFPKHLQDYWPQITGIKCHSVLVPAPQTLSEAVFFERGAVSTSSSSSSSSGSTGSDDTTTRQLTTEQLSSVEVYPRPDGDAYVNGLEGDEVVVIEEPGQEVVEDEAVKNLELALSQTSSMLQGTKAHTQQVCYWPETPDGLPILSVVEDFLGGDSTYLATGHSVWGILQGPISGKAMSELILDGEASSVDLTPFSLERFEYYNYDDDNDDDADDSNEHDEMFGA